MCQGTHGIDAGALRGALAVAGTVIAVRPSGIDQPFPQPLALLADAVAAGGLVVSENPPGVPPCRTRLIAGDRLLGVSVAIVVVEVATGSSAMRVADGAARLRRPVMVVPGPVTSRLSAGCHDLIGDGAHLVTTVEDRTHRVDGQSLWGPDWRTTTP